jgi:hypothetical protein
MNPFSILLPIVTFMAVYVLLAVTFRLFGVEAWLP